jgi:hypothetical protein
MFADLNPNRHRNVRDAHRQAMTQHQTARDAFQYAVRLLLAQEADVDPEGAGRLVAVMSAKNQAGFVRGARWRG